MSEKPVILVVDDDGPILALMRNLLKEFGFHAVTADNGSKAIEAARTQAPSLVLLDRNMPGIANDEVIRTLRSEPGCAELPVLILSGERVPHAELARLGANAAVQKPFDVASLIAQIRSFVGVDGDSGSSGIGSGGGSEASS
ncbi:MAG TPA: response regulator [Thermoanaerobaculia bacterium]|nr:response regulator [Thermoanaerobaculia bacterium]